MRPIDIVRRNGLTLTSLGTSRVSAYGCVDGVGMVDIDMDANTPLELGLILRIWPAPGGLASGRDHIGGRDYVEGMRFAIVGPSGRLVTKMTASMSSDGRIPAIFARRDDHPPHAELPDT